MRSPFTKAQGMTIDHGIVLVDDTSSSEALYVGMTRGRDANEAWVRTEHLDDNHLDLFEQAIGRNRTERPGIEHLAPPDGRAHEERWTDLAHKAREIVAGRFSPGHGQPEPAAEVELDDGLDVGWQRIVATGAEGRDVVPLSLRPCTLSRTAITAAHSAGPSPAAAAEVYGLG